MIYPFKSKLFGAITELNAVQGIIKCDDENFGHVFIPSKADFKFRRCLTKFYRTGDRVSFYVKPSTHPEKGCQYIASGMKKIYINKKLGSSRSDTFEKAKGYITWVTPSHAYIQLAGGGKAFFRNENASNKCLNLTVGFPYRSQVICDLQRQTPQHGCAYRARNVKLYFAEQENDIGSTTTVDVLDDDDGERTSPCENNFESEENRFTPIARSPASLTSSVGCQTEKLPELQAIKEALGHEEVFQLLCQKCPNALKIFMQSSFK